MRTVPEILPSPRAIFKVACAFSLAAHISCGSGSPPSAPAAPSAGGTPAPQSKPLNILVIMTDDQESVSAREMPRLQSLIAAQGVTFTNAIATTPLCGPSRASVMTGRYAHSHGILSNAGPLGGYGKYRDSGLEGDSLPVWLKAAGYQTSYLGKMTNGYGPGWTTTPPGWDNWIAFTEPQAYTNFTYNENGRDTASAPGEYQTDFLAARALDFLKKTEEKDEQPFFLMVATYAPHNVARSASRHSSMFASSGAPRTPAFNEDDVSDKPRHIRRIPSYTSAQINSIDNEYRNSLRSLQAVDEMIEKLVRALEAQGELEQTAIVFFSDNGVSTGAHRFNDKTAPYAESLDIPLYMRVPGGARGVAVPHLVANIDLAATILDWAKAPARASVEGISLAPLASLTPPAQASWRNDLLVEYWDNTNPATTYMPTYQGVRLESQPESVLYVQHITNEEEFYDFRLDPHQMVSAVGANPAVVNRLEARMKVLAACRGAACR